MGIPKSLVDEFPEAARFHDLLEKEARYDSLLSVLRRCVEAMSKLYVCSGPMFDTEESAKEWDTAGKESISAISAAREYLEETP